MTAIHALVTYQNILPLDSIYYKVVQSLLANLETACSASIEQMSDLCLTSPATLTRLARNLGYKGYADFRNNLSEVYHGYAFYNRVLPTIPDDVSSAGDLFLKSMIESLETFRQSFDSSRLEEICDSIHAADCVAMFFGRLQTAASVHLQVDLAMSGKRCVRAGTIETELALLKTLDDRSFLILQTGTLNTDKTMLAKLLAESRKRGAKVLTIGAHSDFFARQNSDFFLGYDRSDARLSSFIIDAIIAQLTLIYRTKYIDR